jgi:nucleotide-binding universal stress UspA family protein
MSAVIDDIREAGHPNRVAGFRSLIVALDLVEDGGDRALPVVCSLARQGGVPVELVTVSSPGLSEDVDAYELELRARAIDWPMTTTTILHDENPAAAIVEHLIDRPHSLLVMATSAKRALTGLFLGGVSEEVLTRVDQPVLLVGPRVGPASDTFRPTLVACVDDSGVGERAVPAISRWLRTFRGGQTWAVEVVTARAAAVGTGDQGSSARTFAALLADHGIRASWDVVPGDQPDAALVEFGSRLGDPIFVATSARWTDGRFHWHSTTRRLVQRSSRPVLVVPVPGDG